MKFSLAMMKDTLMGFWFRFHFHNEEIRTTGETYFPVIYSNVHSKILRKMQKICIRDRRKSILAANKLESMMAGHWTSIRMVFIFYDLLNYEFPRDLELSGTSLQVPSSTFKLG